MDIFDTLVDEHRLIQRTLTALECFVARVEGGAELNLLELNRFVVFLREFVDLVHHQHEERVLFPAMVRLGYAITGAPIAHVHDEHVREHALLFEIRQLALRVRPFSSAKHAQLVGRLRELVVFQREHVKKENELLYPAVKREFSGKTLDEVSRSLWSGQDAAALAETSWLRALAEELIRDHT